MTDNGPRLPIELDYLWGWFNELMMAVAPGGFSAPAATWGNIADWAILMQIALEPWEARMLAHLSVLRGNILAEKPSTPPPPPRKRKP